MSIVGVDPVKLNKVYLFEGQRKSVLRSVLPNGDERACITEFRHSKAKGDI